MSNYTKIPHPLLSDSGTCQSERYPAMLNPESVKIDDQGLEDVLHFINKYARFINFYDATKTGESQINENYELNISNWQELISKSVPFQLASLSKLDVDELAANLTRILQLVNEYPNGDNLQILLEFIFTELILIFEKSLENVKNIDTSFGTVLQRTMSSGLREPLINFIELSKKAANFDTTIGIVFSGKINLGNWDIPEVNSIDPSTEDLPGGVVKNLERTANIFLNELRSLASKTAGFLPQVLYPNQEAQQGKIAPHIGLLIAFLNLQKRFKNDLNDITRRHLLYFYNDVLQIKGKSARPDETFVVFQLQKQVETSYFLPKGTKVKDGKDDNKADIIFALEKDIVLDKAEITELRTLYLNPVQGYLADDSDDCSKGDLETFTEGLYIAPKANSQDGIEEDFKEDPKNWATLGARESKLFIDNTNQEHPPARVGFVLASPVLFLNEGKRKIKVELDCSIDESLGDVNLDLLEKVKGYFEIDFEGLLEARIELDPAIFDKLLQRLCPKPKFYSAQNLDSNCESYIDEKNLKAILEFFTLDLDSTSFSYTIEDVIEMYVSEKIDHKTGTFLFRQLSCKTQITLTDVIAIGLANFSDLIGLFYRQPFKVYLSGEKGWMEVPNESIIFNLQTTPNIKISIAVNLKDDFPAVTFSDAEKLGEPLGTTHPSMKIQLDPEFELICPSYEFQPCCDLFHCQAEGDISISAYHFLRHLQIDDSCIDVEVCGVKNLIVQNDESVQDVNGLIYPFGTRPRYEKNDAAPYSAQGSNFYIGSKEVFCKDWKKFWININWKDKPASFCAHYIGYEDISKDIVEIDGDDFQIKTALLENGNWIEYKHNISVPHGPPIFPNPLGDPTENNVYLFNEDDDKNYSRNIPSKTECGRLKDTFQRIFGFERVSDFPNSQHRSKELFDEFSPYTTETKDAFVRLTLTNLDFQHNQYPFILARQMMAFGKLEADGKSVYVPGAVYYTGNLKTGSGSNPSDFKKVKDSVISVSQLFDQIDQVTDYLFLMGTDPSQICNVAIPAEQGSLYQKILKLISDLGNAISAGDQVSNIIDFKTVNVIAPGAGEADIRKIVFDFLQPYGIVSAIGDSPVTNLTNDLDTGIDQILNTIFPSGVIHKSIIQSIKNEIELQTPNDPTSVVKKGNSGYEDYLDDLKLLSIKKLFKEIRDFLCEKKQESINAELSGVVIPNEPWTPIIKDISIDYTAKATASDIQLVHLHPFENTYSLEDISAFPNLLPVFTDEGTLFIALDKIARGNTLNLLFNMAEATANTEMTKPAIKWSYLKNNKWEELKTGFSITYDGTNGLTRSGIVEITMPEDISNQGHTIMPNGNFWIKAAAKEYSKAVCETISIHTQAAKVIAELAPNNDLKRLNTPLSADKISRLDKADTSIKKVTQPIPSFNGRPPESEAPTLLYRRISERLRHKGRAINGFDYERIVLENFPQVFKTKTISHTLGLPGQKYVRDLEVVAPGYVLVAVIPDIKQLSSGNAFEPRVPLSQLGEIKKLLQKKNSPFIKLKVENPRYEKVNVAIKAKFTKGNTGPYFEKQLEQDIQQFLAPWTIGKTDRLDFGGILSKSDLIAYVEELFYVDYICQIDWVHEFDMDDGCKAKEISCCQPVTEERQFINPLTARSILTAGTIKVCELDKACDEYDETVKCEATEPQSFID